MRGVTIGQAIKKARIEKGYSRTKLSTRSGIGITVISNWENGRSFPNVVNLISVADVLNISLDELVGRAVNGYDGQR